MGVLVSREMQTIQLSLKLSKSEYFSDFSTDIISGLPVVNIYFNGKLYSYVLIEIDQVTKNLISFFINLRHGQVKIKGHYSK